MPCVLKLIAEMILLHCRYDSKVLVLFQDYAIETRLKKSSSSVEGDTSQEVKIDLNLDGAIAAINFVLKVLSFSC